MATRWTDAYSDSVSVEVVKAELNAVWIVDVARKISYKVYGGT
jgi:hypothetical protein